MSKRTTDTQSSSERPRCAACGSPRVVAYQKVGGLKIFVCRRVRCIPKWRKKIKRLQAIQAKIEQEVNENVNK